MAVSQLLSDLEKNSFLLISLHGMRSVLERELGINDIAISTDDMIKVYLQTKVENGGDVTYPYSYISISEMQGIKDQNPNKGVRRVGYKIGMIGATKSTIGKAYMFPVNVSLDFKYVDNDPYRAMRITEALVILSQLDAMYFDIVINENFRFHCRMEVPDTEPIPLSDTSTASTPSGIEVAATFILHTFCGVVSRVAAATSDTPIFNYAVENISGGITDLIGEV